MANKAMLFMQQINNQIEELRNQDDVNTAQLEELYRQRDNYERFPVGKRNYKNTDYNHLRNQIYYLENQEKLKKRAKEIFRGNTAVNMTENNFQKTLKVKTVGKCEKCGATEHLHGHHIIPIGVEGSTDTQDNLSCLCNSCHQKLHHRIKGCRVADEYIAEYKRFLEDKDV